MLELEDKWIWDFWLVRDQDNWHVYFLQADNSLPDPEMRHRNVTQGHAVSKDLIHWTHKGTCLTPAPRPAWDDWTTWTGSVVKDEKGLWHLFYTGTSHEGDGLHQRIGHAVSSDMHSWQRVGNGLCLDLTGPNASYYEEYRAGHWHDRAMRDPWVIRDPDGSGWIMYFTARVPGRDEPNAGGAIGFATSTDLMTWTLEKPVYDGGAFGQLEVPQVFPHKGRWYMMFCTAAEHWSQAYRKLNPETPITGNSYLTAPSHLGPWTPATPFLDGHNPCNRYCGKIVEQDGELFLMGFLYYDANGKFVGKVSDPLPVSVSEDGRLMIKDQNHG